jgi:geranylgeranyl diphosphate synthase type II
MAGRIRAYIEQRAPLMERAIEANQPVSPLPGAGKLNEAMRYALFPGGKRMRPLLVLLGAEICGAEPELALPLAAAVELLHAASLIVDDLPAMDDAASRRGLATVHVRFGEDVALLAALALLNQAYGIFSSVPALFPIAIREIGASGMIGGQAADLCGSCDFSRLEKTTALTRLTMAAGAAAAGANARNTAELIFFGASLGEAYQICDDIIDVFAADAESGKTCGQDQRLGRGNLAEQLGARAALERAVKLIDRASERIRRRFGNSAQTALLEEFARSVIERALAMVKHDSPFAPIGFAGASRVERDSMAGSPHA